MAKKWTAEQHAKFKATMAAKNQPKVTTVEEKANGPARPTGRGVNLTVMIRGRGHLVTMHEARRIYYDLKALFRR